jgi:septal ring factor EnvC (AmiA/AmiB activator)
VGTARAHLRPQNFRRRSTWPLLSALVVALLLATGTASPAYAKPSVSNVEKQIEAANNKLEPIVENYNRVHGELVANQAKANALAAKLQPLQLQAGVALARLQPLIAQAFESGPNSSISMLLDSGSAPSLLNQLTMYDAIAKQQHDEIASVLAVRDKYMAAKTNLDGVVASLRQQKMTSRLKSTRSRRR